MCVFYGRSSDFYARRSDFYGRRSDFYGRRSDFYAVSFWFLHVEVVVQIRFRDMRLTGSEHSEFMERE